MSREKRPLEKDSSKEGMPEEKRQRLPVLASVIVEAVKMDSLQKLCSTLEPLLRRVVGEEVERVLAKLAPSKVGLRSSPKQLHGQDTRNLRLQFRNKLALPLFTGSKVEGEQGSAIHVVLHDASAGQVVTTGVEASAKLEVVVLEGDFSADDEEDWVQEEFENHEVRERDGKRPLLTGDLSVTLKEGLGTLGEMTFTDNSSWIRSRKFRLGVKVSSGYLEGLRIREAKTEAFTVKDHRGELYKKHYPPALSDEVWRLDKIGKDGAFHKRLNQSGVQTVEDFLRLVVMDPQRLRNILGNGMSNKMWEGTVEHAKTCVLSGKLHVYYADEKQNIGVIFNNIFQLMGLIADGQYMSVDSLSDSEKVYVDKLVKVAYENWENVVEYDGEALIGVKPYKLRGIDAHTEDPVNGQTLVMHNMSSGMLSNQSSDTGVKSISMSAAASGGAAGSHPGSTSGKHAYLPSEEKSYSFQTHHGFPGHHYGQPVSGMGFSKHISLRQVSSMNLSHQNFLQSSSASMTGLALGPPQSSVIPSPSLSVPIPSHATSVGPNTEWSRYKEPRSQEPYGRPGQIDELFSEEELRAKSLEILENEDMHLQIQQLLRMFNSNAGDSSTCFSQGDDTYQFGSFSPAPDLNVGTDRGRMNGRANVGWLKLKAALRWGIFIRKRAAAKRARLEELEDE